MLSACIHEGSGEALAAPARRHAWEVARSKGRVALLAAAASLLCLTVPPGALAQQRSLGPGTVMQAVEGLKQGEYLWAPEMSPDGPVLVLVSLSNQRAIAYRNGIPIGVSTVSSGKDGYQTPTGVFMILQKNVVHKSNRYSDAPMPYMQRLTWDGIALHAGSIPGFPASHGCVRLPLGFAKLLYGVTKLGLTVVITNESAVPRLAPTPDLLTPGSTALSASGSAKASGWHPERSPVGPVSIVVSAADKRIVVLRNGVEIGAAGIEIDGKVSGTSAYALRSVDATGTHWVQLPLPGQAVADLEVAPEQRKRFRVPDPIRKAIAAILKPGMTVVLTSDTLISAATGSKLTVIVGEDDARAK
jgi:hypothetical protein